MSTDELDDIIRADAIVRALDTLGRILSVAPERDIIDVADLLAQELKRLLLRQTEMALD